MFEPFLKQMHRHRLLNTGYILILPILKDFFYLINLIFKLRVGYHVVFKLIVCEGQKSHTCGANSHTGVLPHYCEGVLWYFCGARPALTPGATPMRSIGNSASTGFWILCTSGRTLWDSIILSWPRFSPTSKTLHL